MGKLKLEKKVRRPNGEANSYITSFRLDADIADKLNEASKKSGISKSSLVNQILAHSFETLDVPEEADEPKLAKKAAKVVVEDEKPAKKPGRKPKVVEEAEEEVEVEEEPEAEEEEEKPAKKKAEAVIKGLKPRKKVVVEDEEEEVVDADED